MTVLQLVVLALVALSAPAVVLTRVPARQVIVSGFLGLQLAVLFMLFQAPDVALSMIVVSSIALPLMLLLTLAKLREDDEHEEP